MYKAFYLLLIWAVIKISPNIQCNNLPKDFKMTCLLKLLTHDVKKKIHSNTNQGTKS